MRPARPLTTSDRWELGLFLSLLVVGCLCLTAMVHVGGFPRMFAVAEAAKPEAGSQEPVASGQWPVVSRQADPSSASAPRNAEPMAVAPVIPYVPLPTIALEPRMVKKPLIPAADIKWYKGERYRYVRTLRLRVTAYAPDGRCCWPYPGTTTATGLSVKTNRGHLVAADPRIIPMHSLVVVPGYQGGAAVPVLDQGGAIKGHRLDVMLPSYEAAKEWGSRLVDVKVYEEE